MSNWNFEKARIEVSRLFPSQFWCWTKENAENIKKTWKSAEHVCEARVFGNPWQFVRAHQIIKQINDVGIQKAKHAVTVMIALQPIEESLPSFFIEAMNKFSNLDIWIRPHPHQLGGLAEIEKSLRQAGLKNFCIRTGQDLYTDFGYVDLLVTAFSTVATEAMDFGIPVILTHPNSRSAFYGLIDSEKLFYCGNLKESVATISNILKSSRTKDVFEPAKTDFEQMSSCFLQGC